MLKRYPEELEWRGRRLPLVVLLPHPSLGQFGGGPSAEEPPLLQLVAIRRDVVPVGAENAVDRKAVAAGLLDQLKLIRKIWQKPALQPYLKEPGDPFGETDAEMRGYAKVAGGTLYHCVGTVAMGDERYPLDPQLRVRGVEGLRVIDASVMPKISSGNTNAPTIMIAEKGAEMVLADAKEALAA